MDTEIQLASPQETKETIKSKTSFIDKSALEDPYTNGRQFDPNRLVC